MGSFCNYLEVAPNLWAPNSQTSCKNAGGTCGGSATQTSDFAGSGDGITLCTGPTPKGNPVYGKAVGTGYANSTILAPWCNPSDAPNIARLYDGGGMTDWFVPSQGELEALIDYPNRNAIGGFPPLGGPTNRGYWSSTSRQKNTGVMNEEGDSQQPMKAANGFRPVRAF